MAYTRYKEKREKKMEKRIRNLLVPHKGIRKEKKEQSKVRKRDIVGYTRYIKRKGKKRKKKKNSSNTSSPANQ